MLRTRPDELLDADGEVRVLGVGEVLPFAPARRRASSLPVDVARTIEEALTVLALDIVNVHEPFAPSAKQSIYPGSLTTLSDGRLCCRITDSSVFVSARVMGEAWSRCRPTARSAR